MKMLGHLADKLLGAVVPQISASACCTGAGQTFTENCGCVRNGIGSRKTCVVTCFCTLSCGACQDFSEPGCR
jgi:hypothetical protein